jgi:hypothetical protein
MKVFVETLMSRLFPELIEKTKIIPHSGKQDLEKHLPNILKNWQTPNSLFIVIHDQDSWDCVRLKQKLQKICDSIRDGVTVRIACIELESWYWGDLAAVEKAFNKTGLLKLARRRNYSVPDRIQNPKTELQKHLPQYEQQAGARAIAAYIDPDRNTSHSFGVFFRSLSDKAQMLSTYGG